MYMYILYCVLQRKSVPPSSVIFVGIKISAGGCRGALYLPTQNSKLRNVPLDAK
jgi:hypothetical protein